MVKWVASCCGVPISECQGCPDRMVLMTEEQYMRKQVEKEQKESPLLHNVLLKIENKTVAKSDFDMLIREATPASVLERVRRKINPKNRLNRRHHSKDGHASGLPKLAARVNPARKRSNNTQMQHGGRQGHKRSVKTQKKNRDAGLYEAIDYFRKNIGTEISEEKVSAMPDLDIYKQVAIKLMSQPNANRDWLTRFISCVEKA